MEVKCKCLKSIRLKWKNIKIDIKGQIRLRIWFQILYVLDKEDIILQEKGVF